MKANEIKNVAIEIVKSTNSCKDCEKTYKGLIESGINKEDAKSIIKYAKSLINQSRENMKAERTNNKNWFKVTDNIVLPVFYQYLNTHKNELNGLNVLSYKNDLPAFVRRYFSAVNADGEPIKKSKKNGLITFEINTINYKGVLKTCFDNVIKSKYGKFTQKVISE